MSLWRDYLTDEFRKKPERTPVRKSVERNRRFKKWESRFEESQNYEAAESVEYKRHAVRDYVGAQRDRKEGMQGLCGSVFHRRSLCRWVLIFFIGFLCAIFGVGIHMSTIFLGMWGLAFALHFVLALVFSAVSCALCHWEPSAIGSGIPETKSYLNGVQLGSFVRLRTLVAKSLSVVLTVSSGLFAGPEGPMVHVGAIIGASLSRWYNRVVLQVGTGEWSCLDSLRVDSNDTNTRDFVTYGAAAGIAAAFRAPIGGVLFILEEGASFWSTDLTWRTFFCSSVTLLTVIVLDRSFHFAGEDMTSNFSFGKFSEVSSLSAQAGGYAYLIIELSLFLLMGCIGGLLGGIFVAVNGVIARLRRKYATTPWRRLVDVLGLAALTAWMTFTVPLIWSVCSPMPQDPGGDEAFTRDEVFLTQRLVQFDCPRGQYNQVASLFYVDSNTAIKLLFHFREHMSSETFDTGSLLVVLVPYFVLACATCGIAAAAGVFVSCLVSGAVMGRLFGHVLLQNFAHQGLSDAGTYALVGAAAMIGGVCRNTISLTVMLVEATGSLDLVLPIMLALLSSKYVGDLLSPGLYNNLVQVRDLPWLAETIWGTSSTTGGGVTGKSGGGSGGLDITALHLQPISEFMASPVVYLREAESVSIVQETLLSTTHHLFPVLDALSGQLRGTVSRSSLLEILRAGLFSVPVRRIRALAGGGGSALDEELEEGDYGDTLCPVNIPTRPPPSSASSSFSSSNCDEGLEGLLLTAEQCALYVDLRPFLDPAPHVLLEATSLRRAFTLFRTLGLRHLIIINRDCKVTGMVTRKDLTEAQLMRQGRRQQRRHRSEAALQAMSLPNSQQLVPLTLPPVPSSPSPSRAHLDFHLHDAEHAIGTMDQSGDRSVAGEHELLLQSQWPSPAEESSHDTAASAARSRGGGDNVLNFFFPSRHGSATPDAMLVGAVEPGTGVQLSSVGNPRSRQNFSPGSSASASDLIIEGNRGGSHDGGAAGQYFSRIRLTR